MRFSLFSLIILFTVSLSFKKNNFLDTQSFLSEECLTDSLLQQKLNASPLFKKHHEEMEKRAAQFFEKQMGDGYLKMDHTLPVVVHIIHQNGSENISDAVVEQAIVDLNDAFANINFYDQGVGVDTKIDFCLAKRDPDGNAATGINRVVSPLTNLNISQDIQLKNLIRWDPLNYINIWLVKNINGAAGYAYLPSSHGNPEDGIVMLSEIVSQLGGGHSTLVHEMGHYLGLYHTFNNNCNNNDCLLDGDRVCDTPPDGTTAPPPFCNAIINSCDTDINSGFTTDENDLVWNYVDYGNHSCRAGYSQGQTDRMIYFIENVRQSLLSSNACLDPCVNPIDVSFTASSTSVDLGETINFVNTSSGGTDFEWLVNGLSFSNNTNANYLFDGGAGIYEITLNANNNDPNCSASFSMDIEVECPVEANFTASTLNTIAGETINFTNNSLSANNYEWQIDGTTFSNNINATYNFPNIGSYEIKLIATDPTGTCNDEHTLFIQVDCIAAFFETDNSSPSPGDVVSFTNTTLDGQTYSWSVNNVFQNNTTDFNYSFSDPGIYQVCLEANNGFCSDDYCYCVYVNESVGDCDETFVTAFGTSEEEEARFMISVPEGLLIGGVKDEEVLFLLVDENGELIWERKLDIVTNDTEIIGDIILGSDGNIIVAGTTQGIFSAARTPFVLKYDYVNNNLIWVRTLELSGINRSNLYKIIEHPISGNYFVLGQMGPVSFPGTKSDALFFEVDKNSGAALNIQTYTMSGNETFVGAILHMNKIYAVGRFMHIDSNDKMRPTITQLDFNGDYDWSKNYLINNNGNARIYPYDIIYDNDALLVISSGDLNGTSTTNVSLQFYKTNLDGDLLWAKEFFINTGAFAQSNIVTNRRKILAVPDGFILMGNYTDGSENIFLIKTDKNGEMEWSKGFGGIGEDQSMSIVYKNGYIHLSGWTTVFGSGNKDVLLIKMDMDGNILDSTCDFERPFEVSESAFNNPYDGPINLTQYIPNMTLESANVNMEDEQLETTPLCFTSCIDTCQNGALLNQVPDAELQFISASCNGENKTINIQICNNDSIALPINTPISFYNNDPTLFNAQLINTVLLNDSISPNNCDLFSYEINSPINEEIYAVVNDDGTTATPFDLNNDFPNTLINECDFTNNINSFQINFAPPVLNLGPDISTCDFGVVDLDAGAGFISYNWSDATTEQTTTAWQPGVYWVEATDSCGNVHTDSILLEVNPSTVVEIGMDTVQICEGEDITFLVNGFNTYQWLPNDFLNCNDCPSVTATPDTTVTYILVAENGNGCISEDSVTIIVSERFSSSDDLFICAGDSVSIFGDYETDAGLYEKTFTAVNGCDSIVEFNLIVFDTFLSTEIIEICANETADVFGTPTNTAGIYTDEYSTINGCDSNYLIELIVHDVYDTEDTIQICSGDSILIFGNYETVGGVYTDDFSSIHGCDSTHQITLMVADTLFTDEFIEICVGETADVFGSQINAPGIYSENYITQSGCDSTHFIELVIRDTFSTGEVLEICDGDSVLIFGNYETAAGLYVNSFSSIYGCDSVHQVELIVLDTFSSDEFIEICAGEIIEIFGVPTDMSGIYSETFTAINGCDSSHVVELIVRDTFLTEETVQLCAGDSIFIFGNYETQAGTYTELNQTISGCDSLSIVYLEIYEEMILEMELTPTCANSNSGIATVNIVNGGTAPFNYNWNTAGTTNSATITNLSIGEYSVTVTDANNCTAFVMGGIEELLTFNTDLIATDVTCATYEDGVLEIISDIDSVAFSLDGFVYQTDNVFEGLGAGEYNLTIIDLMSGCSTEQMFSISAPPPVNVVLPSDVTIELGDDIFINSTASQNDLEYNWTPDQWLDCDDCPDVVSQPETTILYTLNVFDENNCTASDNILITVELNASIFMPTAFSPNDDGINDVFFPNTKGVAQIKLLRIFNRWGGQVFEGIDFAPNDPTVGWDGTFKGKAMNPAVFAYFMEVIYADGTEGKVEGDLMLVR